MLGCLAVAGLAYNQNSKAPDGKSPGGSVHGGKHQLMEECDIPATLIETDLRVQGMQRQSSSVMSQTARSTREGVFSLGVEDLTRPNPTVAYLQSFPQMWVL